LLRDVASVQVICCKGETTQPVAKPSGIQLGVLLQVLAARN
jgi:hypothetical protein